MRPPDDVLDVPIAPAAALARVERSINRREKRLFGILKTRQEYVGQVFDKGFEVWERQQRAVHLVGLVRARRGGTRIELRYTVAPVTRVVTVVFFALYLAGTVGLALRPPDESLSPVELAAIVIGATVLGGGFLYFARRQRAELAAFIARVFAEETPAGS
ncbi:MAG TPA: hypothetical protein VFW12_08690 [Candidatus Limnocylindria bacterium]|nr:hypothetical protein [Candidatus Limnocylindria bacterium]